ncbi:TPA: hypothetical protein ACTXAV_000185 [Raoultella planticola]|uniref:hypothetical protein n=1 Tax=Raoultella planticola TaxID=575 RepID=UPI002962CCC8|nr:hypothetical protein [Raoultella planticola]
MTNTHCYYQLIQTTTLAPVIGNNAPLAAIRQGEEMIREEDKPAWRDFWLKVVPFLVAVLFFSFACWGGK